MTTPEITGLISNVGFPIAAFLLMYRLADKTIKENTTALKDLKDQITRLKSAERGYRKDD